ncbi:MAG: aldo/keto reductase [Gemmatimonadetes bacterium]|nr:aldo/keto reductase [Gemmatimonadota bacterium]
MSDSEPHTLHLAPGYEIPRIIVGTWQFSEEHHVDAFEREDALDTLGILADAGLTAFDCADIYTGVEQLLGEFFRSRQEELANGPPIRVHTKFVPDRDALPHISKTHTEAIIDRSLRRLGVERLDLVQFAWWDYAVPRYVETALWLQELTDAGKIRFIGATNFDVPRLREIVDAGVSVATHQVQYSLLDHRPETTMVAFCRERRIHLLCYGTLAGGFLSDRWLGAPEPATHLPNRSLTKYKLIIEEFGGWDAFQKLLRIANDIATKHGVSIGDVATRYVLQQPQVGAAIVGARSSAHVQENLRTLALRLDPEDISMLHGLAAPNRPAGDVYTLERRPASAHAAIMRYNLNRAAPDNLDPPTKHQS